MNPKNNQNNPIFENKNITLEKAEETYFFSLLYPKTVQSKVYILKENQPANI